MDFKDLVAFDLILMILTAFGNISQVFNALLVFAWILKISTRFNEFQWFGNTCLDFTDFDVFDGVSNI